MMAQIDLGEYLQVSYRDRQEYGHDADMYGRMPFGCDAGTRNQTWATPSGYYLPLRPGCDVENQVGSMTKTVWDMDGVLAMVPRRV